MNDKQSDFMNRLKTMSIEDLKQYDGVTGRLNFPFGTLGVFFILFMMFYPSVIVVISCSALIYFLATISANTSKIRTEIRTLIATKDK